MSSTSFWVSLPVSTELGSSSRWRIWIWGEAWWTTLEGAMTAEPGTEWSTDESGKPNLFKKEKGLNYTARCRLEKLFNFTARWPTFDHFSWNKRTYRFQRYEVPEGIVWFLKMHIFIKSNRKFTQIHNLNWCMLFELLKTAQTFWIWTGRLASFSA